MEICYDMIQAKERVIEPLQKHGFHALFVGGCVRDTLMSRIPHDIDIVTDATPEEIKKVFPDSFGTGEVFLVMNVVVDHVDYEVATFREDGPDRKSIPTAAKGSYMEKLRKDAERRDFTINAMYYDPMVPALYDFFGGQKDIEKMNIKFVGDAEKRIEEDPLRILRAFRFMSTLNFFVEKPFPKRPEGWVDRISGERIGKEMLKMADGDYFYEAICSMNNSGVLDELIPEWKPMKDCICPPQWHTTPNAAEHTLDVLFNVKNCAKVTKLAAFFHDFGKPSTQTPDGKAHGHADVSAIITEDILKMRWHINYDLADEVVDVVQNHMKMHDLHKSEHPWEVWKFLQERPNMTACLMLLSADNCDLAPGGHPNSYEELVNKPYFHRIETELPKSQFNGFEFSEYVKPGKHFQSGLDVCYNAQIKRMFLNMYVETPFTDEEKAQLYKQAADHVKQLRKNDGKKASV